MAHRIFGFIAKLDRLCDASIRLEGVRVIPLALEFGFLPIVDNLIGDDEPVPFDFLSRLTARLAAWAERESHTIPIAYIETDYFGGTGTQAAVVWQSGRIVFGPEQAKSEWVDRQFVSPPLLDKAINRALRLLGAERGTALDEFDALRLGRHRSNDRWLSAAVGK